MVPELLTELERKTLRHHEDGESPVQTDALLYVSHKTIDGGDPGGGQSPLYHPHVLPPGALVGL